MENSIAIENIEEGNIIESEVKQEEQEEQQKFCLNCGTPVNDKFCPHCGQSTAVPKKLKMKNFGKGVVMSFGRLTPGFVKTAKGLMFHPWTVIRDHIHGRHVPYSPPITMIIQIMLYSTIIFAFLDSILGTHTNMEDSLFDYQGDNPLIKLIDTSVVISTLLAAIPICFCVYIAYYRHGARKYNFAEYLAAFTYFFAGIGLWDTFFAFFDLIPGFDVDLTFLTFIIATIFSIIVLLKAFPQRQWWISAVLIMWCGFILILGALIIGLLIALPHIIKYYTTNPT